ncbi:MAG: hypothetical protein V7603_5753 [Micromonosporaceae bacterium]
MFLILPSTLLLAGLIASPALWHAFVVGDLSTSTALARFLIAVPVSGLMMAILRGLTSGYRSYARRAAATAPEPSEEDE